MRACVRKWNMGFVIFLNQYFEMFCSVEMVVLV